METSTIKWFNTEKGFGFIEIEDGNDVSAHFSVNKSLNAGQRVQFNVAQGNRMPQAENVSMVIKII